jgi:nucleoside-diphosphate-sugar epimerase
MVFHLAAIYDLAVPLALAQKVNVDGTGNVIDFCRAASNLRRHVYVSTAYVAGDRKGTVYEHELVLGQDFKNHYESTKFQAEVWVRDSMAHVPTTILRPAIVVGDSQTGETEKFDGPYYLLRAISQAAAHGRPPVQFGHAEAPFNVVPVDYVVAGMVAASQDDAMTGETLHLVDPDPLTSHELLEALSEEYGAGAPKGRIPPGLVANALRVPQVRKLFSDTPSESIAYLNHPVTFDTRRAVELLAPHDLRPPSFRDYSGPMVAFFKEHEHDRSYAPKRG